jgi:DNA-binding NarL/FixJ family response regulator
MGVVSRLDPIKTFESALMAAANGYAFKKQANRNGLNSATLSYREATVLTLLTEGHRNKEVARRLDISDKTVSTYKRRILDKFEVDNIMELLSKPEVTHALMSCH